MLHKFYHLATLPYAELYNFSFINVLARIICTQSDVNFCILLDSCTFSLHIFLHDFDVI